MAPHLLVQCECVKGIWEQLAGYCQKADVNICCSFKNVVLDKIHEDTKHVMNYVCTIVKQYVYRCRCLGEKTYRWESEINYVHNRELFWAERVGKVNQHIAKWLPVRPELALMRTDEKFQEYICERINEMPP